jgi:hypothetical protein
VTLEVEAHCADISRDDSIFLDSISDEIKPPFCKLRVFRESSLVVISTREVGGKRIMAFDKVCDPIFANFRRGLGGASFTGTE